MMTIANAIEAGMFGWTTSYDGDKHKIIYINSSCYICGERIEKLSENNEFNLAPTYCQKCSSKKSE